MPILPFKVPGIAFGTNPWYKDANEFPNSFWNPNGTINCSGIFYCEQAIIC